MDKSVPDLVRLRALDPGDLDRTLQWHNDASLYESLGGAFRHISRPVEEEWLRRAMSASSDQLNLAICAAATGEHIGNIYLKDIDWIGRRAEMHVFIADPVHRGKGYGSAAVRRLVEHARCQLGLNRLFLFVLADNIAAVRTYEKCGFAVEGRLRSHAFKGGAFRDVLLMGLAFLKA